MPKEVHPPGMVVLNFNGTHPVHVLETYTELSGMQLVTSSHVNAVTTRITLQPQVALKKSKMLKLVEKALLEQAGIVVTQLDDRRVSVTYNDTLTVTAVADGKPIPRPIGSDGKPIQPPSFLPPPPKPIQK